MIKRSVPAKVVEKPQKPKPEPFYKIKMSQRVVSSKKVIRGKPRKGSLKDNFPSRSGKSCSRWKFGRDSF